MPLELQISDDDIKDVAHAFGCQFSDEARRAVLSANRSRDIQAGPGTGKTTVLVAKLAILAKKWRWKDRGLCVLSHTNAARHEIQQRLGSLPSAHALLAYPHFIGTIQAFVDQFLALPALRYFGYELVAIDNERVKNAIVGRILQDKDLFVTLKNRKNGLELAEALRYVGPNLDLGTAAGAIPFAPHTATYKKLKAIKDWSASEGLFRFDDMYAFAQRLVEQQKWIIPAIRRRFPWVLLDEVQDTDRTQDDILQMLFSEGCILQRFGDANQAIFWSGREVAGQSSFPAEDSIDIPDTKRFSKSIARFASPLTAVYEQELQGTSEIGDRQHMVFLFDDESISKVLPAFSKRIEIEWPEGRPEGFVAKAVGFRKEVPDESQAARLPFSLCQYHKGFEDGAHNTISAYESLIDCIRKARRLCAIRQDYYEGYRLLLDGLCELLKRASIRTVDGKPITRSRLLKVLGESEKGLAALGLRAYRCLSQTPSLTETDFTGLVEWLLLHFDLRVDHIVASATAFSRWVEATDLENIQANQRPSTPQKCLRVETDTGPIEIEVASIHSVKGQTHTATLVLETFYKNSHDMKMLLPFLCGNPSRGLLVTKKTLPGHMKRVFVGMTRPRELLCLAIHVDHIGMKGAASLRAHGWAVDDLTTRIRTEVQT